MYGSHFYHRTIRTYNAMFGTMFNDISIKRYDKDGVAQDTLKVPISFAPKEEFVTLLRGDAVHDAGIETTLPRMSFEMPTFSYAPDRMTSVMEKMIYSTDEDGARKQYSPVAYDFNFVLSIFAKNLEDGYQIIEQILPYFNPTVNWPVKDLPELDGEITHDIAIELTGNNFQADYEGLGEDDTRFLQWDLDFTLRGYLFKPSTDAALIKTSIVTALDYGTLDLPYEDRTKYATQTAEVVPESADPDDPHEIVETTEEYCS